MCIRDRIYTAIIRPMLTHGAVVWWPWVELGVARTLLSRLQRLAYLAITGAHTPTAVMEVLTGLLPLDIYIKLVAMSTYYSIKSNSSWGHTYDPKSHTHVLDQMHKVVSLPVTKSNVPLWYLQFHYDLRKHYFTARIVNIWNSLPNQIVDVNTVNLFKHAWISFGLTKVSRMISRPT